MKRIILIILFLKTGFIYAQTDTINLNRSDSQINEFIKIGFDPIQIDSVKCLGFDEGDSMPYYKDGDKALKKFILKNTKYPEEAAKNRIEGEVIVRFTIGMDGSIQDVELLKKAHPLLNAEALRIMSLMPKWVPGQQGGKPIPANMRLPLKFVSPKSKKTSSNK